MPTPISTTELLFLMERKAESAAINNVLSDFQDFYKENYDDMADSATLWDHSVRYFEDIDLKSESASALYRSRAKRREYAEEIIAGNFLSVGYPHGSTMVSAGSMYDAIEKVFIIRYITEFEYSIIDMFDGDAVEVVAASIADANCEEDV